jgi:hypothetical protein
MPETLHIIHVNGHYEVYINGEFYCSTDSMMEAINEVENMRE